MPIPAATKIKRHTTWIKMSIKNAGDRHICGYAELRKKPCADDVAADADERKQRIDRFANKPQAGENVWPTIAAA